MLPAGLHVMLLAALAGPPECSESDAYPGWPRERWDPLYDVSRPLPEISECHSLDLNSARLSADDMASLSQTLLNNGTNITSLDLSGTTSADASTVAVVQAGAQLPLLSALDVGRVGLLEGGISAITALLQLSTSLRSLRADWNSVGDAGAASLAGALGTTGAGLELLALEHNAIGDAGGAALGAALSSNSRLRTLQLEGNDISALGVKAIGDGLRLNTRLELLGLSGNPVGQAGAAELGAALASNDALRRLELSAAGIGDDGAVTLAAALRANRALQELLLQSNAIGDAGAIALAEALFINENLRELHLELNHMSATGVAALAAALRNNLVLETFGFAYNYSPPKIGVPTESPELPPELLDDIAQSLARNRQLRLSSAAAAG